MNNEFFINTDPGVGNLPFGAICASNAARMDAQFYTQPLTTFVIGGWDKDDLNAILNFIAPAVEVEDKFEYRSFDNSSDFIRDEGDEDRRNINGDFPRANPSDGVMVDAHTDERGFTIALDTKKMENDPGYENREVMKVTQRLLRNELRRAFALLDASSITTSQTWSGTADPDMLLIAQLEAARVLAGLKPNKVLFGDTAWTDRLTTYRSQNTAGGTTSSNLAESGLGAFLGADVSRANQLYRSPLTGTLQAFIAKNVYIFNNAAGLGAEDPSNIKRFVTLNEGQRLQVYRQQTGARKVEVTVAHQSLTKITSINGIRKLVIN